MSKSAYSRGRRLTVDEINAQCVQNGECLLWTGTLQDGIPMAKRDGKHYSIRKVIWDQFRGASRGGVVMTCGNSDCLNPAHMQGNGNRPYANKSTLPKLRRLVPVELHITEPNSPESFAICDAIRLEMGTTARLEREKSWLKGR